jgi:hypothetical protein
MRRAKLDIKSQVDTRALLRLYHYATRLNKFSFKGYRFNYLYTVPLVQFTHDMEEAIKAQGLKGERIADISTVEGYESCEYTILCDYAVSYKLFHATINQGVQP